MKYPWLFEGARVVCIDNTDTRFDGAQELINGTVYTVRWVGPRGLTLNGAIFEYRGLLMLPDEICVRLIGVGPRRGYGIETGQLLCPDMPFSADRFAPVTTINTDSQIAAMKVLMQKARDENREGVRA